MNKILLSKGEWEYDPQQPLGKPGGFGQVFVGSGQGHQRVAIKRLHLRANDAAHRELKIAEELAQRQLNYVVPVYDAGYDSASDAYYVVMALAGDSLQHEIDRRGKFSEREAIPVLLDIANGLLESKTIAVHRDLKPLNVLPHDGHWKIADYGIARFVEDATSSLTLKGFLSQPYAAPEQWRNEHATPKTDVYALGCIAHALLTGAPPFSGPSQADYSQQHIHQPPPKISGIHSLLEQLMSMLLRKQQDSRPEIERVVEILNNVALQLQTPNSGGFGALGQVGAGVASMALDAEAKETEKKAKENARDERARAAIERLEREVIDPLLEKILQVAPAAQRQRHSIVLGTASLNYQPPTHTKAIVEGAFQLSKWDVLAMAMIRIVQNQPQEYVWSANLFYTNRGQGNEFRWWETQFMTQPLMRGGRQYEPFAVGDLSDADMAASSVMGSVQYGAKPKLVDDENTNEFHDRWAEILARAANGQLRRPNTLPYD